MAFEQRVRDSFGRQAFMSTLGARLTRIDAGQVEIRLTPRPEITQQHGFVHAAAVAAIADSACGYAAFTLMPEGTGVLTTEYKINLLAPARGGELIARGRVVKEGRTLTVCQADVIAVSDGVERAVAVLLATVMTIRDRPGVLD